MNCNTVIFDLDGTLLDTLEDLADSVNYALNDRGHALRKNEEVRQFVGNGVGQLMKRALPIDTSKEEIDCCLEVFRKHYTSNMNNKTRPYKGILELLEELAKKNVKMAIVSNKFDLAVKALCKEMFSQFISEESAIGEKEGIRKKPAPDSAFEALRILSRKPSDAIYVGDSDVDIETAKNAGIFSVGVTWGFRDREVLEKSGADKIIDSPSDLLKLF